MPQTLLAFLAIMLVSWMIFGQQRLKLHAQREAVNVQFEVMGSAVASERMQYVASHPFDAKTADGSITQWNANLNDLTPEGSFGTGGQSGCIIASVCKDIDDFHMHRDTVDFEQDVGIQFAIHTAVGYVENDGSPAAGPTWTKEVTVTVHALPMDSDTPFLEAPVKKTRRFSPNWNG